MREIKLTQEKVALVDDEDFERSNRFRWYAVRQSEMIWYACRCIITPNQSNRVQSLHRYILDPEESSHVDHINGDGLDNRRVNLRIASHAQNMRNGRKQKNNTSGFIGVWWAKRNRVWVAGVRINGKLIYVGSFNNPVLAAKARDDKAKELHGEYASLNFLAIS